MLITIGVIVTTTLLIANACALADVIEHAAVPAPIARVWLIAIILVPGIGAALWFSRRSQYRSKTQGMSEAVTAIEYPSAQDIERFHEQIDRFRATRG